MFVNERAAMASEDKKGTGILKKTRIPVYLRIQEALREAIESGSYKPGGKLPTEAELSRHFSTTRATVTHALQALVFAGLIERRQGVGTFVASGTVSTDVDTNMLGYFEHDMQRRGKTVTYEVLRFQEAQKNPAIARKLGLADQAPLHCIMRLRRLQGKPFAVEERYISSLTAACLTERMLTESPLQPLLENALGRPIGHISNVVRAAQPTPQIAAILGIAEQDPVLLREHTIFNDRRIPILWGKAYYRKEYQIEYSTGDSVVQSVLRREGAEEP